MTAVGCLLTYSAVEVVDRQPWRSDVRAAAGSAACSKEKEPRGPSDFTQTGLLACPFTGEVR